MWGLGSSFPSADRQSLAETVAGTDRMPAAPECFVVAGALASAAGLILDVLPLNRQLRTVGVTGAAMVLATRGVLGVLGQTNTLVPWTPSDGFKELDRKYYGPLCLALSVGALSSLKTEVSGS